MANSKTNPSQVQQTIPPQRELAVGWRVAISVALIIHLIAVVAAPFAVPPSSELQLDVATALRPYICAAYLDHGYRFFAPQPSPGHIVRYKLELPDGTTSTGRFPDLSTEWPRLLYHRHFMLSEKLTGLLPEKELPGDAAPADRRAWQHAWQVFDDVANSYAQHLLNSSGAKKVTLELVSHELPTPDDMQRNRPIDDPGLFQILWTKSYEAKPL